MQHSHALAHVLKFQLTHGKNYSHKMLKYFFELRVLRIGVLRCYTMHGTCNVKIVNAQQTTVKAP